MLADVNETALCTSINGVKGLASPSIINILLGGGDPRFTFGLGLTFALGGRLASVPAGYGGGGRGSDASERGGERIDGMDDDGLGGGGSLLLRGGDSPTELCREGFGRCIGELPGPASPPGPDTALGGTAGERPSSRTLNDPRRDDAVEAGGRAELGPDCKLFCMI